MNLVSELAPLHLGGVEAVKADPSLRNQLGSFLKESDQMMMSAIDDCKSEVQASRKMLEVKLEEASQEARLQQEVGMCNRLL